jgi:hypothetical protein
MIPLFDRSYLWFPTDTMGKGLANQIRPAASEQEWARVDSLYQDVSNELELSRSPMTEQ